MNDDLQVLKEGIALGPDVIRLGGYWDEIQPHHDNKLVLGKLGDYLDEIGKNKKIKVIITAGMKAPRSPEFWIPDWVKDRSDTYQNLRPLDSDDFLAKSALDFVGELIQKTKDFPNLTGYQIENEALNRLTVGSNRFLSSDYLKKAIAVAKESATPNQKIFVANSTALANPINRGEFTTMSQSLDLGVDAVGVNVYTRIPNKGSYDTDSFPFWQKLDAIRGLLQFAGIVPWVPESQAEPWEPKQIAVSDTQNYGSSTPDSSYKLIMKLGGMGYDLVLPWGVEHWEKQRRLGNPEWRNKMALAFEK